MESFQCQSEGQLKSLGAWNRFTLWGGEYGHLLRWYYSLPLLTILFLSFLSLNLLIYPYLWLSIFNFFFFCIFLSAHNVTSLIIPPLLPFFCSHFKFLKVVGRYLVPSNKILPSLSVIPDWLYEGLQGPLFFMLLRIFLNDTDCMFGITVILQNEFAKMFAQYCN